MKNTDVINDFIKIKIKKYLHDMSTLKKNKKELKYERKYFKTSHHLQSNSLHKFNN